MKHFKNTKIFTLLIAVPLILALSISCKSNEEPTKVAVEIPSQYYGTWVYTSGSTNALKLESSSTFVQISIYNTNGSYLDGQAATGSAGYIDWSNIDVTKNSDTSWSWKGYTFSFNSSTGGTLSYNSSDYAIIKKQN
ncbi:hypothetical protein [Brachyspira aalborgi]|uniref:hypothetical protein n=1 Tax=Brachyspira aalborgi TaxID=29522 RepID=UPI0026655EB5|nr:hypothetical protein [Brachyspira aalborgi]